MHALLLQLLAAALTYTVPAMAQDATTTVNPLNNFIGGVQSGINIIKSADGTPTASSSPAASSTIPPSSSMTTPTAASATSSAAAAAHHGLSTGAKVGIIIGAIAAAIFLLGLILGLCCCCVRRRRHHDRNRNTLTEEEYKQLQTQATHTGPTHASHAPHTRQSMEQSNTTPLMTGAVAPRTSHSAAPSLSQHPALRNNRWYDDDHHYGRDAAIAAAGGAAAYEAGKHHNRHDHNGNGRDTAIPATTGMAASDVGKQHGQRSLGNHGYGGQNIQDPSIPALHNNHNHGHDHHYGRDAAIAGAGGVAAYETGKHRNNHDHSGYGRDAAIPAAGGLAASNIGKHHNQRGLGDQGYTGNNVQNPSTSPLHDNHDYGHSHHYGQDAAIAAAGGAAASNVGKHHGPRGLSDQGHTGNNVQNPSTSLIHDNYDHGYDHHYGRDAAIAAAGGAAAYEAGKHRSTHDHSSHGHTSANAANPFTPAPPPSRKPVPQPDHAFMAAIPPTAIAEKHRRRNGSRSRSRSSSRPKSGILASDGGLPTHNNADRPPTPFGLNAFGQTSEDKHAQTSQIDPPSAEQRRSLHEHEMNPPGLSSSVGAVVGHENDRHGRNSRGYETPPEIPSRSPNRESKRPTPWADNQNSSSYSTATTTTNSTSAGEEYQQGYDPYSPANIRRSQREALPPWEQHQYRYSGNSTPPTSATMVTPPVPWVDGSEYTPRPRRNSHSPRQSMSNDGRRKSRSPATGINGQPRRLRFEDLQSSSSDQSNRSHEQYGADEDDDGYNHVRWSQGVGEAM